MTCEQVQELIHAYIDGELDLVNNLEIEGHLGKCEVCQAEHQQHSKMRASVQGCMQYFSAPEILKTRIEAQTGAAEGTVGAALRGRPWFAHGIQETTVSGFANTIQNHGRPRRAAPTVRSAAFYFAATVILAVSGVLLWAIRSQSSADNLVAQEVVSSHIRSMMLNHLVDVPSSDQHTVKPWFNGKLDFAPDVKDLAAYGFPLVGGRLDYIDNHTVAALVYQRRKHSINLFIWPSTRATDQSAQQFSVNGYNIIHWTSSGSTYWAVSDVNSADLSEFAKLVSH